MFFCYLGSYCEYPSNAFLDSTFILLKLNILNLWSFIYYLLFYKSIISIVKIFFAILPMETALDMRSHVNKTSDCIIVANLLSCALIIRHTHRKE